MCVCLYVYELVCVCLYVCELVCVCVSESVKMYVWFLR